jgi:sporulation protein YlmC with PRC-barrel domain
MTLARVPDVLDAGLALLDRQIVDCDGRPVAKVDDLEIAYDAEGRPYISALLYGAGAAGPRIRGRVGRAITAIWRRSRPEFDPKPARIPMSVVSEIDSAVHLSIPVDTIDLPVTTWVNDRLIRKIPGAGHGA